MKKKIPTFETDAQAEDFVADAVLADYDLSGAEFVHFEPKPKDASVNIRLPEDLLNAVRDEAAKEGVPYERFIRSALERALQNRKT